MKTNLEYTVVRREEWDYKKNKTVSKVVSRGFNFYCSGADTEKKHNEIVMSFEEYLLDNGFEVDGFCSGSWEEAVIKDNKKDFYWLSIEIEDTNEKDEVKSLYKKWKLTELKNLK